MFSIKDARIGIGPKNEEKIAEAHTDSLIHEYSDRRGSLVSSRWQKIAGYSAAVLGVTALVAGVTLAPYIAAPTALGILKVSGAIGLDVGAANYIIGAIRDFKNRGDLKRIPRRA